MSTIEKIDVVIIGAGPSGSSAAALLRKKGYTVTVIEKQHFPRFSIGESLLPQSMAFLEEAGLLETVREHVEQYAFQFKNGAAFYAANSVVSMTLQKNLPMVRAQLGKFAVQILTTYSQNRLKLMVLIYALGMRF